MSFSPKLIFKCLPAVELVECRWVAALDSFANGSLLFILAVETYLLSEGFLFAFVGGFVFNFAACLGPVCSIFWPACFGRSIPIVSKLDFTNPAYNKTSSCGVGMVAWNVVAASPFAKEVSVNDWTELPALLDRLRREPDDYIDGLQVRTDGIASAEQTSVAWSSIYVKRSAAYYRSVPALRIQTKHLKGRFLA